MEPVLKAGMPQARIQRGRLAGLTAKQRALEMCFLLYREAEQENVQDLRDRSRSLNLYSE